MLHGPAKGEAVKALAEREGLDLSRCSAYSDSYNDLPMLSPWSATPARSTPTRSSATTPGQQGWRIRDYRTGRKAARAGLVVAGLAGAVTGSAAAAVAIRRRVS